jgi:solute carrier family 25 S-adenosylmethionine transporter 26
MEAIGLSLGNERGRRNTRKAWVVACIRDVPFGAIQIALFEVLKVTLSGMENPPIDGDTALGEALLGAFGGAVGSFISAPPAGAYTRSLLSST